MTTTIPMDMFDQIQKMQADMQAAQDALATTSSKRPSVAAS